MLQGIHEGYGDLLLKRVDDFEESLNLRLSNLRVRTNNCGKQIGVEKRIEERVEERVEERE